MDSFFFADGANLLWVQLRITNDCNKSWYYKSSVLVLRIYLPLEIHRKLGGQYFLFDLQVNFLTGVIWRIKNGIKYKDDINQACLLNLECEFTWKKSGHIRLLHFLYYSANIYTMHKNVKMINYLKLIYWTILPKL
jgi:hypothetical protein